MDPKLASMRKSGQALGWLRQKLIPKPELVPVVEVRKAGAQTSCRPLKAERERFGALHRPKVEIQCLKKTYYVLTLVSKDPTDLCSTTSS